MTTLFIVIYINAMTNRKIIAIIKAVGVDNDTIVFSYVLQSVFFAICGIIFGLLILHLVVEPYFLANPLDVPFGLCSIYIKNSLTIRYLSYFILFSIVTGFIPAYQVVKQNIIETMRS
jgi:putative ABC transport system permease protein